MPRIALEDVKKAQSRIQPYIRTTPLIPAEPFERLIQKKVLLKCENLQRTGSFKLRGATNCALENMAQAKKNGVVTASAGNHAQGVACICKLLNIKATIVMPVPTPAIKIQNTENWGAKVELVGTVYDEAFEHATELSKKHGYVFIHPFNDPLIMAGQGTIALEMLEHPDFKDVEAVAISIGGGGLISGVGSVLKQERPDIKIYGITAQNAPSAYKALKENKPQNEPVIHTLAEGVAAKRTEIGMLSHIRECVDEVLALSEESIAHAISTLAEQTKLIVEGAGALPVAALLDKMIPEKKVAAILSGGNIDLTALSNVLQRGLVEQNRLVRLLITIPDRPGGLHSLTGILADHKANILQVFHQRLTLHSRFGETEVEIDVETRGKPHTEEVIGALSHKGFHVQRLS